MALNTDQTPDGRGVVLFNGEIILIFSKTVTFELHSADPVVNGKRKGPLYLTSHRIIFNNKNHGDRFKSFSMPFHCLREVKIEQPVFGANFLKGVVLAQPNGNWEGSATFKLTFDEGGCIDFGQAMLHSVELARQVHAMSAPPPYMPPTGGYFCPPPACYTCQAGVYNGVTVPVTAFPDAPPAGSVYMYEAPPPYPGIAPFSYTIPVQPTYPAAGGTVPYPSGGAPPAGAVNPGAPYNGFSSGLPTYEQTQSWANGPQYPRSEPPPYPAAAGNAPYPVAGAAPVVGQASSLPAYPVANAAPYPTAAAPAASAPSAPYPMQNMSGALLRRSVDLKEAKTSPLKARKLPKEFHLSGTMLREQTWLRVTDSLSDEVPSLIRLSACASVGQLSYIKQRYQSIPRDLWPILLQAALIKKKDTIVRILLKNWPFQHLSLREQFHWDRELLQGDRSVEELSPNAFYMATALLYNFIECLRLRVDTCSLRVLDLRGFPLDNLAISYLSVYCILSHDEAKRNQVQKLIKDVVRKGSFEQSFIDRLGSLSPVSTTLMEGSYMLIVDCVIQDVDGYEEFCKALKICSLNGSGLQLIVNEFVISSCGCERIQLALELLNPEHVTSLGMPLNLLRNDGWLELLPEVSRFTNLVSLDISSNVLNFYDDLTMTDNTRQLLRALPKLRRLNLANNRLSRQLSAILSACPHGLTDLNLNGCRLTETDLIYLGSCDHTTSLQVLDLSANDFQASTSSLCCLFRSCRDTLRVLGLEHCQIKDIQLERLVINLLTMGRLRLLSLASNGLHQSTYETYVRQLKNHESLLVLRISYPVECYEMSNVEAEQGGDASRNTEAKRRIFDSWASRVFGSRVDVLEL